MSQDAPVGNTPHDHSGRGIPINAAFIVERNPVPDRCCEKVLWGMNACINPAIKKPSKMYGDISLSINSSEFRSSIM